MEETNEIIKKGKLNKTWLLVIGLVILTVVLLITSFASKNFSPLKSTTNNENADFAHTSLSVSEDVRTISEGNYETDVLINTNGDKISGAQIELAFEPTLLTNVDISPGNFLSNPNILIKSIDTKNGTIKFIIAIKPGEKTVGGTGTIATLSFTKISSDPTNISFLPTSQISTTGLNKSVLKETISADIP